VIIEPVVGLLLHLASLTCESRSSPTQCARSPTCETGAPPGVA
jgi:hypothetical protein